MYNSISKKIKVLLISPLPNKSSFGGIGIWASRFVGFLQSNEDVEIRVVNSIPIDKKGNDIARTKNLFKKINCNLRVLKAIKKELSSFKPDIVHVNSSCTSLACLRDNVFLKTIRRRKIPSILHCRCNIEDQINNNKIGLFFFKKNIKMTSAVFALNQSSLGFIKELKGVKANPYIIPNFLDSSFILEKKNIKKHITDVVFVGHLVKEKGIDEIIYLAKEFPNINFTLVSGYTEQYPEHTRFPSNIKVTGNVQIEFVFDALDKSDLFLFPTYSEGFANALLEAMARGLPVITTNVGANFEMLEDKGGLIVSPKSKDQIKNAFLKIGDECERKKMSCWNIEKVKNSYTIDIVSHKIISVYYDIITKEK